MIDISFLYIEIATLVLILVSFFLFHLELDFGLLMGLAVVTGPLFLIDIRIQRVPNLITLFFTIFVILISLLKVLLNTSNWGDLVQDFGVGFGIFIFYFSLYFFSRGGMGLGDVKLAFPLGLLLANFSWQQSIFATLLSFFIGGAYGVILLMFKNKNKKHALPFVPFMLAGAWLAVFSGVQISSFVINFWALN